MATTKGTIFKCDSCSCELICISKCERSADGTPTCCCGEKMKKTCEPTCVS